MNTTTRDINRRFINKIIELNRQLRRMGYFKEAQENEEVLARAIKFNNMPHAGVPSER